MSDDLRRYDRTTRSVTKIVLALIAGVLGVMTLSACTDADDAEQNDPVANANYEAQKKRVPIPNLSDSLERRNIAEHLKRNNQPDRTRYLYVYTRTGAPIGYYVIKGKVTSAGAQLTPTDDIVDTCSSSYCPMVVQGPTDDGSYGGDEGGIYFFTADGIEIQTNLDWVVTDAPMKIDAPQLHVTVAR